MTKAPLQIITGATVVRGAGQLTQETVVVEGNRIVGIAKDPPASLLLNTEDVEIIPANGMLLTPGLIDQHFHGGFGCNFNNASIGELQHLMGQLPAYGITGAVPTVMTAPQMDMLTAVNALEAVIHLSKPGQTRVLGIHLEGPFLNPDYRGAHPKEELLLPTVEEMQALISPNLRMMTLAPELDPHGDVIRYLTERGVAVSAGHSGATLAQIQSAIRRGVRGITHLFNAMCPFHHREPGILGAALNHDELTVEIIGDGIHVHPEAIRMALRAKRLENVILISDCLSLTGLPDGQSFTFGNQLVTNRQGRAINAEGHLAGGTQFLNECFRNLVRWKLLPPGEAITLASTNPAQFLGFGHELGRLEPGFLADMVLWDIKTLTPQATWIDGALVYSRLPAGPAATIAS
jgi:N-acetylglucosamine-6-phosphate deacetylase